MNRPNKWPKFEKNSNANVLKFFPFALQMWVTIWAGKPDGKRNIFTMWQEFRSKCRRQIQMNTLIVYFWMSKSWLTSPLLKLRLLLGYPSRELLYWYMFIYLENVSILDSSQCGKTTQALLIPITSLNCLSKSTSKNLHSFHLF